MSVVKSSPIPRTEMDALLLGRLDELADSEPNSRGRSLLGIILSILVLLLISSLIVAAIVILNPEISQLGARRRHSREAISLDEALLGSLGAREFQFKWLPASDIQRDPKGSSNETDQLIYEDNKNLYLINLQRRLWASKHTNDFQPNLTLLVSNTSLLSSIDYQGFKLSPSGRHLLLWTAKRKQFRHSFTAVYFLYDLQRDLISMLSTAPRQDSIQPPKSQTSSQETSSSGNQFESLDSASFYLNQVAVAAGSSVQLPTRFQLVDWFSADGSDSLIMVQSNDIFVLNNVTSSVVGAEDGNDISGLSSGQPIRLTRTGIPEIVFNGVPDWLYEEEILAGSTALQVAPNGQRLAFMAFNDSQVASFPFVVYRGQLEPMVKRIRHPRAGQPNPVVSVHVIENLSTGTSEILELRLPEELSTREHYINRLQWLTNEKLGLIWSSRAQNESAVLICGQLEQWHCETSYRWHSREGWLDIGDHLMPLDSTHYLLLVPHFESPEVGSFTHLAKVALDKPNELTYLTSGRFEVVSISGVDSGRQLVYLTSTLTGEPGQRHLQVVGTAPRATGGQTMRCITCELHPNRCQYNEVKLSPSNEYFVFNCDGPDVPLVELRRLQVRLRRDSAEGQTIEFSSQLLWTIEDNHQLREKLTLWKAMPVQVRLRLPIEGTPHGAHVMLLLPPLIGPTMSFRATPAPSGQGVGGRAPIETFTVPSSSSIDRKRRWLTTGDLFGDNDDGGGSESLNIKGNPRRANLNSNDEINYETLRDYLSQVPPVSLQKYPMIVEVYGGPNSQRVDQRFGIHLGHYFASNRRTIYAMIDVRGSGLEGTRRSFELHHRLGTVEVEDQLQVASQLARGPLAQLVDPSKMAIWGWSYGGYAAAMALATQGAGSITAPSRGEHLRQVRRREVFECAASVAPVTDWTLYDTAYTEKYMSSPWRSEQFARGAENFPAPDANQKAEIVLQNTPGNRSSGTQSNSDNNNNNSLNHRYRRASLLERVKAIDRKRFLLIHGTADDNVHYQHSVALMKELIKRDILFETRLYPDQDHSISGRVEKLHLGATLSNFFAECFDMAY